MRSTDRPSVFSRALRSVDRKLAALCCALLLSMPVAAAPLVAASIRPLQLIAAAITDGVSEPVLVLGQGQDPHNVSLRPSERRALADAEVVLWTGPMLELPLAEVMNDMGERAVTVQELDGLVLHEVNGNPDPHAWLDTRNAALIAKALAEKLIALDAPNAARYQANLDEFTTDMRGLEIVVSELLSPDTARQWAVYHNAFRYFERQYALAEPLALNEDSNGQTGARSLMALRDAVAGQDVGCLLTEPTMNSGELRTVLGEDLRIVTADIMGLQLEDTPDTFMLLLWNLAGSFADCLQVK